MARSQACQDARDLSLGTRVDAKDDDGFLLCVQSFLPNDSQLKGMLASAAGNQAPYKAPERRVLGPMSTNGGASWHERKRQAEDDGFPPPDDDNSYMDLPSDGEDANEGANDDNSLGLDASSKTSGDSNEDDSSDDEESLPPDDTMYANFRAYCTAAQYFSPLSKEMKKCLGLMYMLRRKKTSLDTYDAVMEWHLKANGVLHPWEKLSNQSQYLSRQRIFNFLRVRYNRPDDYIKTSKLVLPYSQAAVNIVWTDAKDAIVSLLTDPRIRANDYIFEGKSPFLLRPKKPTKLGTCTLQRPITLPTKASLQTPISRFCCPLCSTLMGQLLVNFPIMKLLP